VLFRSIVVVCIISALVVVGWINKKLKLPRRLGSLIAIGTSICGVSAIVATGPVIDAEEDEVTYAVTCITVFGLVATLSYPYLAHWLFAGDARMSGLFLGTAIHDTSQVAGAGLMYQQQFDSLVGLNVATVTKLVRNLFMMIIIPLMAAMYHHNSSDVPGTGTKVRKKWYHMVPLFVIGFVILAIVRSVGDIGDKPFGLLDKAGWCSFLAEGKFLAKMLLSIAMAAIGLNTSFKRLKTLGFKPFCVGFSAALLVGVVSFIMVKYVSPLLSG